MEIEGLLEVMFECFDEVLVMEVMRWVKEVLEDCCGWNYVRCEGKFIIFMYINKMWFYDIVDMVGEFGLVGDVEFVVVFVCF